MLFSTWMTNWVAPNRLGEGDRHRQMLDVLTRGDDFHFRPILLGATKQIHDGKHRLFAAYDYAGVTPGLELEVFWNQTGP